MDKMNSETLTRETADTLTGITLLEFGASGCPYCQSAQPVIESALTHYAYLRHIKIEDGKGKRLGRSYAVKLWPTLIFLNNGQEFGRSVRPLDMLSITEILDAVK